MHAYTRERERELLLEGVAAGARWASEASSGGALPADVQYLASAAVVNITPHAGGAVTLPRSHIYDSPTANLTNFLNIRKVEAVRNEG